MLLPKSTVFYLLFFTTFASNCFAHDFRRRPSTSQEHHYQSWHFGSAQNDNINDENDDVDSMEDDIVNAPTDPSEYIRSRDSWTKLIQQGHVDWEAYKTHHSKHFNTENEENERMLAFLAAQQHIRRHNDAFERGQVSYKLGMNHIADLLFSEYQTLNGYRGNLLGKKSKTNPKSTRWLTPLLQTEDIPESIDWREHGLVTDVKDQGNCGSCWSFSTTGALEGQHKRATGNLISLSEQNLIDCSTKYGNYGCNGGLMDFAFEYIKDNHGIDTEEAYPYKGVQKKCHFSKNNIGAEDTGFVDLPEGDEDALKIAVATQGPISVAIDAGHRSFQLYKEGIYFEKQCSPTMLNHAVLIVGYGTNSENGGGGGDYWIVKNSWSKQWGENGYIRMARNKKNHCGIASKASYPLV